MLFKINPKTVELTRVKRVTLSDFSWNERKLQELLFRNLDEVIQTEELLVISQSRNYQEEPDLMALDENGDLWIFELKAWESEPENILQALRYGQIFGQYNYEDLDRVYERVSPKQRLLDAHHQRYPEKRIQTEDFNRKQHFVIITNGLDIATRQAINFWMASGLVIMPWIYRLYQEDGSLYLEFNPFRRTIDNPFEDIESRYFIVNTNRAYIREAEAEMLEEKKAAAYYSSKETIMRIQPGDRVFLYGNEDGIIAGGAVKSQFKKKDRRGDRDAEYFVNLKSFRRCNPPMSASEIHHITDVQYPFMHTCMQITDKSGELLWKELVRRSADRKQ